MATAAKKRTGKPAAAKKTAAAKRSTRPTGAESRNEPKLSKTDREMVVRATKLGLDVDPANFDRSALRAATKAAEQFLAFEVGAAIEVVGTDGKVFDRGFVLGSTTASHLKIKSDLGDVSIPVELIAETRPAHTPVVPVGSKPSPTSTPTTTTRRASTSSSEPRAPREGSGLWAALEVLKKARTPMSGADVFAKIKERKLAPNLKGKTPEATITAALNVAAARGQHGVTRPEPGRFALQKGGK